MCSSSPAGQHRTPSPVFKIEIFFMDTHSHTTALPELRGECGLRDGKKALCLLCCFGQSKTGALPGQRSK